MEIVELKPSIVTINEQVNTKQSLLSILDEDNDPDKFKFYNEVMIYPALNLPS